MAKIKIGTINGKVIYTGDASMLRDGEYYISILGNAITGLFIKHNGKLEPICNCNKEEKNVNLQEINILSSYHGDKEVITPSEEYDYISKVTYKNPKLEKKDTVQITRNGVTKIKAGKGFDGLEDITVIVNVKNN